MSDQLFNKIDRNQGLAFSSFIFSLVIGYFILILIYVIWNCSKFNPYFVFPSIFVSISGIIGFLYLFRLKQSSKQNIALSIFYLMVAILTIESTLSPQPLIAMPAEIKRPIFVDGKFPKLTDRRSRLQVMQDYRKHHITAYPAIEPSDFIGTPSESLKVGNDYLFPLTSMSDSMIIFDNESGEWQSFQSDEHGFNNPKGLYKPGMVDVLILGDSYAQGMGVKQNENFAGVIREKYPRTLTVGVKGTGPMSQLAIFREYVEVLKPKAVVWFFYETDLIDLGWELNQPQLTQYLNVNYRQNLFDRQSEIDQRLKVWLKEKEKAFGKYKADGLTRSEWVERIKMTLKLDRLRILLGLQYSKDPTKTAPVKPPHLAHLEPDPRHLEILKYVHHQISQWGGKLYVAAIPTTLRVREGVFNSKYDYSLFRNGQLAAIENMNIPLIDLYPIILSHPDPLSLYRFRRWGHYNEKGYRFIAESILKILDHELKDES